MTTQISKSELKEIIVNQKETTFPHEISIKNRFGGDYAANLMEHLGFTWGIAGKMKGVQGISKNPKWSNWQGFYWGTFNIELSDEGLKKLEADKKSGRFDLEYEVY